MQNSKRTWPGLKDKSLAIRVITAQVKKHEENKATILAALRLFQKTYRDKDAKVIRKDWPEHFYDIAPLGSEDIDALCEEINFGTVQLCGERVSRFGS